MDGQQKQIQALQEMAQNLEPSTASRKLLEKLEMLEDRWEALTQILEVQGQRVS